MEASLHYFVLAFPHSADVKELVNIDFVRANSGNRWMPYPVPFKVATQFTERSAKEFNKNYSNRFTIIEVNSVLTLSVQS